MPLYLLCCIAVLCALVFVHGPVYAADAAALHPPVQAAQAAKAPKAAATQAGKTAGKDKKKLHGNAWAFGASEDRNDALWRKGMASRSLTERALGGKKAADTSKGIDSALETAEKGKGLTTKNGVGLDVRDKSSSWRKDLPSDVMRPDESLPMQNDHVVRAFAAVPSGEDLSISVGPELILKGEREHVTNSKRPDSALGMGMQFKMDF